MINLPRFLCFCNYFCFAGIVAEANCTPTHCRGNVCLPPLRVCKPPYNFQSSFCNSLMISCSIHGVDEMYSCKESLRNSTFLVEQSACGLRIARISPNLKIWSFCGKGTATNPHTWILFPILGFCKLSRSQYWKFYIPIRCSRFFTVTSIMVSNWTYLKMRVSNNKYLLHVCHPGISPNSVLSKDSFLLCSWTVSSDVLTQDCGCRRCCRCCFSRGLNASWRQRFPMHARKIDLRVNVVRILWTWLVIFHGRLGRFEASIIEFLFLLAQFWTVTHHPRIIKIHKKTFRNIQWWYLYWKMILNSFSQLFIDANRQPLR